MRSFPPALLLSALALVVVACGAGDESETEPGGEPAYVGAGVCSRCHPAETELWRGSHHDLAMEEATVETVRGSFDDAVFEHRGVTSRFYRRDGRFLVETEGPDGKTGEFEIAYTFGVDPLQQYLVELPRGRLQALSVAWDTRAAEEGGQRWFHLYPDDTIPPGDPLHWTGRLQNWNLMCAECHSTNLDKAYDFEADSYQTKWSEIDVSCEACHGPGSRHALWGEQEASVRGEDDGLVVDLSDDDAAVWAMNTATGLSKREPPRQSRAEVETCARCHARRSPQLAPYEHGAPLLDTHRVALLEEGLYHPDGQVLEEVYVYGSFLQSKMHREGVTCKDCHDPHGLHVRGEASSVCASCHDVARFEARSHHHHEPGSRGASCVECHMPATTYMVVDPRRDHSFRVPRPDLTVSLGVPNACNQCHEDRSAAWAADKATEWYGAERPPHYGEALHAGRRSVPGSPEALAALAADGARPGIVRATALQSLGSSPFPAAASAVREGVADDDPIVRLGALEGAAALDPAERHRLVVPLLSDPILNVRLEAARLLAELAPERFTAEERRRLDDGVEEYRQAQLRNADWPESHMNLALLHAARGELPEARRAYENALRRDPGFTQAYVNLADLHRLEGRDSEGEALLRRAARRAPDAPELQHALGLALVRSGKSGEALEPLGLAAELAPEVPRYAYVYGVALDGAGDGEEAIQVLERALASHPHDRDVLHALAAFEAKRGRLAPALEYARRLVQVAPEDPEARQLLAALESGSGH